jgi:hypothetical protein
VPVPAVAALDPPAVPAPPDPLPPAPAPFLFAGEPKKSLLSLEQATHDESAMIGSSAAKRGRASRERTIGPKA